MSKKQIQEILDLQQKITEASDNYYNGEAVISDEAFDALVDRMKILDPNNKSITSIGAPVPENSEWKKEKHLVPLGSLNKVATPVEMTDWLNNKINLFANGSVTVSEKIDGLSIGCQYDNGILTKAILRGAGEGVGEDIYTNFIQMKGVVKKVKGFTGVIRGEVLLKKSDFNAHFPGGSNPRNVASGTSRRITDIDEKVKHLSFIAYDVMIGGPNHSTEMEKFNWLIAQGFEIPFIQECKDSNTVNTLWKTYNDGKRDSLDYEIDGLVVSLSSLPKWVMFEERNHRPGYRMAYKFARVAAKSTVTKIVWETGKGGRVCPVCWFKPVELNGTQVQKASVYNCKYMQSLQLGVGAEITVEKCGDIIPRVMSTIKPAPTPEAIPTNCPSCDDSLTMNGEYLECHNFNCPAQVIGRLEGWIKEIGVLEWGEKLLTKLVESKLVKTQADLYRLTVDQLASLERMGDKSAKKAWQIINSDQAKNLELQVFFGGLSLSLAGTTTFRLLKENGFDTIEKVRAITMTELENIAGIGPARAQSLLDGVKSNSQLIDDLIKVGVKIKMENKKSTVTTSTGKLAGVSFCFTGKASRPRKELKELAETAGATVKDSVAAGLTYLVEEPLPSGEESSKSIKAQKLGVKLLTENQFINLVS